MVQFPDLVTQSGSKAPPGSIAALPLCSFDLPDAAMVASTPFGVRSPPCPKARRGSVKYCAVSRVTPDKFLARIAAHMPTMDAAFDNQAWAVKIWHRRACGAPLSGKKRDALLARLEEAAKRAEADAAPRAKVGCMATPAAVAPVARQETEFLEPARGAERGVRAVSG